MANFPIKRFRARRTPFYYYDRELLGATLDEIRRCSTQKNSAFKVHYALKANPNPGLLKIIAAAGFGADCVSGGEIEAALKAGFPPGKIVYAGVGKSDREIRLGLKEGISCFNVESAAELQVIAQIARRMKTVARVAFRVNPNVDAHTHKYITTGLEENKFGISLQLLDQVVDAALGMDEIKLVGLHFHIGSQIRDFAPYELLCQRINSLQAGFEQKGIRLKTINVGGGLGIDYEDPDGAPMADFEGYFSTFAKKLELRQGQELHFELGRSVVAQCGTLITRVLYVKEGVGRKFAIVDAGMTDLIRPALYQARHRIENLTSKESPECYDVVGPICESADCFATQEPLNRVRRGDLLALRSAGAYGEAMASRYNCRRLPSSFIL